MRLSHALTLVTDRAYSADFKIGLDGIESGTGRLRSAATTEFDGDGIKFREGDLLFGKLRPYLAKAWLADRDGAAVGDFLVLRHKSTADSKFLNYVLLNDSFLGPITAAVTGAKMPRTDWATVKEAAVNMPPLDEQRAIADYLDNETAQIDALVTKQEELIRLLRERRRMAIDRTLSLADDDSSRVRLKYMLLRVDQGVSPQAENALVEGEEWGVLKTGCVNGGTFHEREHKRLPEDFPVDPKLAIHAGDLIVSRANGTPSYVGSAALVEQVDLNLILSDKLFRLVPRPEVDAQFLAWSMNSRAYRSQVEGSISGAAGLANNLPLSDLRSFKFPCPEISTQKQLVKHINEQTAHIDTLIVKAEEHIALAKERRSALITAAVTGQFDVGTARKAG